jgi:3-methylcrotonyl-CoA carboxylase alpha subunit
MFRSVLIANRGEIACRVIRTARRMGLRTVAVYSEADRDALHATLADLACPIGPAPARDSYLDITRILDAVRRSGAEAVHPGYGFLSENAEFAEACAAAGVVFIGPPPAAIRAMGSKSAAKALMAEAGVPLVPGYHGDSQDPALLAAEAGCIGYPVLIKASAGGGGKGMRVVERPDDFADALALAQGEARASFGDDQVLVERYLTRPRHIEIQVFADAHGNLVSLFERDCSIQRRHQKVLEEAPAPGMTAERRAAMGRAAVDAARAIGYQGAGTVEFIAEGDGFYFMEMNTRLQVEHPVTEMITGQDLVEWQLRVAAGERLPMLQDELAITGHAIEVRLYAEDPARDYMPSTGRLAHVAMPAEGAHVRVDTGVRAGDTIPVHYDPMIAKLIVWDHDRAAATRRLQAALAACEIVGVQTNLGLLRAVANHPGFAAGGMDTGFLGRHPEILEGAEGEPPPLALAAIAAHVLAARARDAAEADPHSPWSLATAWRLNGGGYQDLELRHGEHVHALRAHPGAGGAFRLDFAGETVEVARGPDGTLLLDGVRRRVPVVADGARLTAVLEGVNWPLVLADPLAPPPTEALGGDRLLAPVPGRVVSLHAAPGDTVQRGAVLLVLEAMKVQMRLLAPRDAVVDSVRVAAGDLVEEGTELVGFVQPPPAAAG